MHGAAVVAAVVEFEVELLHLDVSTPQISGAGERCGGLLPCGVTTTIVSVFAGEQSTGCAEIWMR